MRLHIAEGVGLVAFGLLVLPWLRDRWRSRRDELVDAHPMAEVVQQSAVVLCDPPPFDFEAIERERAQARAISERLRRPEVSAR